MTLLLLLAGAALGPHGLSILTPPVLAFLDPAAPVGLALLGIVAAMHVTDSRHGAAAWMSVAVRTTVTGGLVIAGLLMAPPAVLSGADEFPRWGFAAIACGIAAATSSTVDGHDALAPIVAGGLLLAFARAGTAPASLLLTMESIAIAALVAASGWLLLSRSASVDEQRVSTFSSVLLLGGAADYLSLSALLCGAAGGACWRFASVTVREHLRRDITYAADSLLALVLLLAGAHTEYAPAALVVAVAYTALRAVGLFAGDAVVARLFPTVPRPASRLLLAPGAIGVAFALNVVRALGPEYAPLLTVVVVGTLASSALAMVPREANA